MSAIHFNSRVTCAPKVFKKLESFTSMTEDDDEPIRPLYESLTLICDNILNMDLSLDTHSQMQLLANLSVSKNGKLPQIGQFISLQELYIENLMFNNNFNGLRRFSFDCGREGFDANKLLCQMAENIPESLETIKIRMVYRDPWIFSARDLRIKRSLTPRDFSSPPLIFTAINSEHFKVIKEHGIQFDMK
ncbi:8181_t:CDS:2 [Diversispora eburnea]|uniref:8181_t:CDS:1 n=1 Tax=Diversispora eburnea TaxID=1213867 RepID=A0A9N9BVQ6_9GLOM|nr:8181_t:CDS:2 [Diversispora eburnea]